MELPTPQAVHRLRSRGKLIGSAVGDQTWFPVWQFDADRVRADLPRILDLLTGFTSDPFAADRVMRLAHEELSGTSIAEALRRPEPPKPRGGCWPRSVPDYQRGTSARSRPTGPRASGVDRSAGSEMWRIDATHPAVGLAGFPAPRYRFDPPSGAFRAR